VRELGDFISNVGFPVFVAVYLLLVMTPAITRLTKTMERLERYLEEKSR